MQKHAASIQRRALRGWLKWVPVVAIPFSILFFHAWLNIQILRADYVLRELNSEARELEDRLAHTGIAETIHEDPEVLAERAAVLEFVQPSPGQREIIHYDPASLPEYREGSPFALALRDAPAIPEPAADESQLARESARAAAAPATAPLNAPAPEQEPPYQPEPAAPVVLEIEPSLDSVTVPVDAPAPATAAVEQAPEEPVVLDLPDTLYVEEPLNRVDAGMGSLESL